MKKTFVVTLLGFAVGFGALLAILKNPLGWEWVRAVGNTLVGSVGAPMDEGGAGAKADPERKIKYWRGAMDATFISDKPGKSPMGMDLIPVYEDEADEAPAGTITIDPSFVQNIGVQSRVVERRDIPFVIRTVGTLEYNEQQTYLVTTKYEGWVENVYVNYVGEQVKKGQALFEVYSPQLVATQEEYLQAVDYARKMNEGGFPDISARARSLLQSARERLEYWDVAEDQIQALNDARQVTRTLKVVAPAEGFIVWKVDQSLEGMFVKPGMNIYRIADLSTIWVEVDIFEHQVPWMKLGQKAVIELPYEPGKQYVGVIKYLYPYFEKATRTMKVSIELPNPGFKLRADMYANVTFEMPAAHNVLTVPEEAVIHSGLRNVVVLARPGGRFEVRKIALGRNGDGVWEVTDGIEDGDSIVTSAQFLIDSESSLKEAIAKMVASKSEDAPESEPSPAAHQHEPEDTPESEPSPTEHQHEPEDTPEGEPSPTAHQH